MKLLIIFVTITCFLVTGCLGLNVNKLVNNLLNPKDDCGNICGRINTNTSNSSCGDPDKRASSILLVEDPNDRDEGKTDYFEALEFECVAECLHNFQLQTIDNHTYCVKNASQFMIDVQNAKIKIDQDSNKVVEDIKEQSDNTATDMKQQNDDKFDYTWWIVGGSVVLVVAITSIAIGVFLKKRSTGTVEFRTNSFSVN